MISPKSLLTAVGLKLLIVIDYTLGKITISNFNPTAVNNDFGDIMVHIKPKISIIQSKLNKMLVLDADDPTSVVVKTNTI
jgi:hypothetical protein